MKLKHLFNFSWLKNSDVTACCSSLVFRDFERASSQDSIQQPNLRRKKKPKDLK